MTQMKIRPFSIAVVPHNGQMGMLNVLEKIERILQDPKSWNARNQSLSAGYARIDHIERKNQHWFMNFAKSRDGQGPVKMAKTSPLQGFRYNRGETPGEETAAMYDQATHYMVIQQNHHGIKVGGIQEYINRIAGCDFMEMHPVLAEDIDRKLRQARSAKTFCIKMDARGPTSLDHLAGISTGDALAMSNAQDIELVFRTRMQTGLSESILAVARRTREAVTRNGKKSGISKLTVKTVSVDKTVELLDLMAPKMEKSYEILLDNERRIPLDERYKKLKQAFDFWLPNFKQRRLSNP